MSSLLKQGQSGYRRRGNGSLNKSANAKVNQVPRLVKTEVGGQFGGGVGRGRGKWKQLQCELVKSGCWQAQPSQKGFWGEGQCQESLGRPEFKAAARGLVVGAPDGMRLGQG